MKRSAMVAAALAVVVLVPASLAPGQDGGKKIKVAVVGDSLCTNSPVPWPTILAKQLGGGYEVKVFAANGLTVQSRTYRTIWGPPPRYEHVNAAKYAGDITLVCFGANCAKPENWKRKDEWAGLYKRLVGMYKGPNRKVYIVLPPPATTEKPWGISREILHNETIPALKQIAAETGCEVIDTHTPMTARADVTGPDGLYPTPVGHEVMAAVVLKALTGKEAAVPAPPKPPTPEETAARDAVRACKAPHVKQMNVGDVAELTPEYVADPKGDGPDGRGNTEDDTWQFWFELAHARKSYHRLDLATKTMPEDQRKNGIFDPKARRGHQKKVTGPIASRLPNPADTEGWIFRSDWDGRNEGFWGDLKAKQVLAHPFVEKMSHCAVAVSFRVPADGTYDVSGRLTDMNVVNMPPLNGILWQIEVAREYTGSESPEAYKVAAKGGPIGDKQGPDSAEIGAAGVECRKGDLIRLVIDPNGQWGTDLTKVELKIKRVK